jgi:CheY-like chemotaxis protein
MVRILIVDDEPMIAMLAQEWLEDLGHEPVGPALDLQTALNLANEPIDAAILDVSLGAGKSYEIARLLRDRTIPFAFASGQAPGSTDEEFEGALMLVKPYSFETFSSVVARLVERAGA